MCLWVTDSENSAPDVTAGSPLGRRGRTSLALLLWVVYLAAALVLIIIRYHRLSVLVPIVAGGVWVVALVLTWSYG